MERRDEGCEELGRSEVGGRVILPRWRGKGMEEEEERSGIAH
jgi:hypothetical protein